MEKGALEKSEMLDMLDIIHATINCDSIEAFQDLAVNMQNILGYSQSAFCWKALGPGCLQGAPQILNVSFPKQYFNILKQHRLWAGNPIAIQGMQQPGLQSWQKTYKKMAPSQQLLDVKRSYNLDNGYSFSVHSLDPVGVTILSISDFDDLNEERWQFILNRLMPHFHLAMNRISQQKLPSEDVPSLTKRELEVLSWLKDGKTSWEISVILDISERTINFHVANVKQKLNASNRMNAVAQAMHLGLVC